MLRIHYFGQDGAEREATLAELPSLLGSAGTVWIDMQSPTDEEFRRVADLFRWHPLAIEDCLVETHLPKVDDFGDYLLLVLHGMNIDAEGQGVRGVEVEIFLSRYSIVTHRAEKVSAIDDLLDRTRRNPALASRGPAYLLYLILDAMEDVSLPYLDALDDRLDAIDEEILSRPTSETLTTINRLKRDVAALRRFVVPQAEVIRRVGRGEFPIVPAEATVYFRDIYDQLYRVAQTADGYRDLLTGSLDSYLSAVSNNLNIVMKVLTVFASIMLPLTFLAGIWGMNFRHMPELEWRYGYLFALLVMGATGAGLAWFFKRRRWL